MNLLELSQKLLLAVKTDKPFADIIQQLADYQVVMLKAELIDDLSKIAFWLNIYNAFAQVILRQAIEQKQKPTTIFKRKNIQIAQQWLSLDEIEHGILRRSQFKYGLGYLTNWWISPFEKANRVSYRDYRIHFALNCGAKSCPPIAFYTPQNLDNQLDTATKNYLESESHYDPTSNTVYIAKLMFWFRGDFGGIAGVMAMLQKYQIVSAAVRPKIRYQSYDWRLELNKFA
ncbi:MAG: DUF547 domain-containing protein [Microscillaceae bacterium]|jgi:hypothetical protein|nr:DUF547 domain-containing protein [Microscillaceae bacterium]